jgi:ABC-2 type transport system ATP-binding protein
MIETSNLNQFYGKLHALIDLNLVVETGDVYGFIGPNGAGKTTTMKILSTLMMPSRGDAKVCGVSIFDDPATIRRNIGYMPDFFGVYDDLLVHEYLEFFAAAYRIPRRERLRIVDDVLELTDLASKRDMPVDSLSRGMQQRLGLARVLVHDPKVLLLDEPASGLDPRARIEIREMLKELQRLGKTILVSSHILSELAELCNRIGIIEKGRLIVSDTMDSVMQRAARRRMVHVQVAGDREAAAASLSGLSEIEEVQCLDGRIDVRLSDAASDHGIVAEVLVKAGHRVLSVRPEEIKLEDAFMRLTKGIVS